MTACRKSRQSSRNPISETQTPGRISGDCTLESRVPRSLFPPSRLSPTFSQEPPAPVARGAKIPLEGPVEDEPVGQGRHRRRMEKRTASSSKPASSLSGAKNENGKQPASAPPSCPSTPALGSRSGGKPDESQPAPVPVVSRGTATEKPPVPVVSRGAATEKLPVPGATAQTLLVPVGNVAATVNKPVSLGLRSVDESQPAPVPVVSRGAATEKLPVPGARAQNLVPVGNAAATVNKPVSLGLRSVDKSQPHLRVSDAERERRRENKLCFYCGEASHWIRRCPSRPVVASRSSYLSDSVSIASSAVVRICTSVCIYLTLSLLGYPCSRILKALLDSGASLNLIHEDLANALGLPTLPCDPIRVTTANGRNLGHGNRVAILRFTLDGREHEEMFLVAPLGGNQIILGMPWLERVNPEIDWKLRTVRYRPENGAGVPEIPVPARDSEIPVPARDSETPVPARDSATPVPARSPGVPKTSVPQIPEVPITGTPAPEAKAPEKTKSRKTKRTPQPCKPVPFRRPDRSGPKFKLPRVSMTKRICKGDMVALVFLNGLSDAEINALV